MRTTTRILLLSVCAWCGAAATGAGAARRRDYEPYLFTAVPLHAPVPVLRVLAPAPLPVRPPRPYASPVQHTPFTRPYADHGKYAESRPYPDVRLYTESRPYTNSSPYTDTRPYTESRPYAESRPYSEGRPYVESRPYSGSRPYVEAVEYYDEGAPSSQRPVVAASSEYAVEWNGFALPALDDPIGSQETSVMYARPSGSGGYTYRKVSGKQPPKKVASSKEQPVLVKIHKLKVIKS